MTEAEYRAQCRRDYDDMVQKLHEARRLVPPSVRSVVTRSRLMKATEAAAHLAADRLMDTPENRAVDALLADDLGQILAKDSLVDLNDELIAHGVQADATCFGVPLHE